ncbi:hypothetical protein SI65_03444 [Aspergillus cristatus]|uniref:Uncharacterized protein n=1 Tax=Aspergillus cristatus TaxID=573508 RepID=A0A1E3BHW6_ASPCR|nr:hypothetical protein SI65_03444 [Aspergillus cristatus]
MTWESVVGIILSILYLILYPLVYALWGILKLLQLLATPFASLGLSVLRLSLWPFKFLARFEVLFIYLAMAILIGAISGLVLYCTCTFTVDYLPGFVLGSSRSLSLSKEHPKEKGRQPKTELSSRSLSDIPSYKYGTVSSDYYARWGDRKGTGPLSSTILEEEESDGDSDDTAGYGYKEEEKVDS